MSEKGFPILLWWPTAIDECILKFLGSSALGEREKTEIWDIAIDGFNKVLDEDLHFGGWIQKPLIHMFLTASH